MCFLITFFILFVVYIENLHIQSNKLFDSAKYDHHVLQYIDSILYKYKPGLNGGFYSEESHLHTWILYFWIVSKTPVLD